VKRGRTASIKRVLWVVLFLNVGVAVAKLLVGYAMDSLAVMADGFHSLLDGSSNVIGLVGVTIAARPPDASHPYGHQKYEAFSALGIALLLVLTAVEVVQAGMERLTAPVPVEPSWLGYAVMGVTMVVNGSVSWSERRWGKRLDSQVLLADAGHTRSDLFVSASVIAGLIAAGLQVYWLDVVVALIIAALILYISYTVLRGVSSTLTDSTTLPREEIAAVVHEIPEVRGLDSVRSRGEPPHLYIDLSVRLDPDLPLWRAHQIAHDVERHCKTRLNASDVVVHVEPQSAHERDASFHHPNRD